MEDKTIVEVNGIKLEIDLRHAKKIDTFRIGDKVKVLVPDYNNRRHVCPGVIVGFEPFRELPTIIVAYLKCEFGDAKLVFLSYNTDQSEYDLVPCTDDYLPIEKDYVVERMDREITKKETELAEIKARKDYFLNHFDLYFDNTKDKDGS